MFRDGTGFKRIYIACGYTDLRYGVDGFATIIQNHYSLNPFDKGTLFLFCGRRSDRIKGLAMYAKW
ncbi:MAG: IS66 family insertion sequence element accessory protein TnpB [Lachnospiraceae bacterium]|nr:IS66 family insertion sequence element accessory protein TnpB [Lachnospiraceae bacterium]